MLLFITITLLVALWFSTQRMLFHLSRLSHAQITAILVTQIVLSIVVIAYLITWFAIRFKKDFEIEIQKKTEELQKIRDHLYTIINDSAEAIVSIDTEGKVASWNKAAEEIYGYTAKEMVGEGLEKLLPQHLIESNELEKISRECVEKGFIRSYLTERIRKDGQKIHVVITRTLLKDKNGKPIGSSAIVRDLTQLKEMETKLIESERLAAVGELAASIAHEIKNPLAGIRSASEIIADSFPKNDPKLEMLNEIIHQIDRLDRTVKDLLIFARPKPPVKVECIVNDILHRVLPLLREDPSADNIRFVSHLSDGLPPRKVDPQQIEQVFINVGLNALQAMNGSGTLTVSTYAQDSRVFIAFADTGSGIPKGIRNQIYKPFYTTKAKGSGLGLPIVKKIVTAHGGDISFQSTEGKGTTFIISFPS